jgi:hypothetical protein
MFVNVLNLDNISCSKFDALIIPNYSYIYDELKISDHNLPKLILDFQKANKVICTIGHSTYAY